MPRGLRQNGLVGYARQEACSVTDDRYGGLRDSLAACTTSSLPGTNSSEARVKGGTATVALAPGEQFNFILPLLYYEYATGANIEYSEYLMWRPLYWFGGPDSVGLNEKYSLADPATVTSAGGKTTATIQLKPYRWSDGQPVTSRDVQFWFNLLKAEKTNWWGYVAGEIPGQRLRVQDPERQPSSPSPSPAPTHRRWLYNELGQLIPIPAADRGTRSRPPGPVGNYDLTTAGAQGRLQLARRPEQGPVHVRHEPAVAGRRRPVPADQLRRLDR